MRIKLKAAQRRSCFLKGPAPAKKQVLVNRLRAQPRSAGQSCQLCDEATQRTDAEGLPLCQRCAKFQNRQQRALRQVINNVATDTASRRIAAQLLNEIIGPLTTTRSLTIRL